MKSTHSQNSGFMNSIHTQYSVWIHVEHTSATYHTSCCTKVPHLVHFMCKMSTKFISIETVVTGNTPCNLRFDNQSFYSQIEQVPEHSSNNIKYLIYTNIFFSSFFILYSLGFLALLPRIWH